MAKSINVVVIVVFFLLISAGMPNGYAKPDKGPYCTKSRSKRAPPGICDDKVNGNKGCFKACKSDDFYNGKCMKLPKDTKDFCYCYIFDDC